MIFGEVGLSGEVRAVSLADQRIAEAERMGFSACILPRGSMQNLRTNGKIRLIGVSSVAEAMKVL